MMLLLVKTTTQSVTCEGRVNASLTLDKHQNKDLLRYTLPKPLKPIDFISWKAFKFIYTVDSLFFELKLLSPKLQKGKFTVVGKPTSKRPSE